MNDSAWDQVARAIGASGSRRGILGMLLAGGALLANQVDAKKRKKRKKKKRKPRCDAGQALCGSRCVDTATDADNCGRCGATCPERASCVEGGCALQVCAGCAYETLQEAIDAAEPGDTIRMAGEEFIGYATVDRDLTIIGSGRPFPFPSQGPATVITAGSPGGGAAIHVQPGVVVSFRNLFFTLSARQSSFGGAMRVFAGAVVELANCWIYKNQADYGGGLRTDAAQVTLRDSYVSENQANKLGGGIFNGTGGQLTLIRSEIRGNKALGSGGLAPPYGGGIYNQGGSITNQSGVVTGNMPDQCANTTAC